MALESYCQALQICFDYSFVPWIKIGQALRFCAGKLGTFFSCQGLNSLLLSSLKCDIEVHEED